MPLVCIHDLSVRISALEREKRRMSGTHSPVMIKRWWCWWWWWWWCGVCRCLSNHCVRGVWQTSGVHVCACVCMQLVVQKWKINICVRGLLLSTRNERALLPAYSSFSCCGTSLLVANRSNVASVTTTSIVISSKSVLFKNNLRVTYRSKLRNVQHAGNHRTSKLTDCHRLAHWMRGSHSTFHIPP